MARTLHSIAAGVAAAAFALAAPVHAQQKLKIGFITTLSGPPAIIGKHMKDSVEIALDHLGGNVGASPLAGAQCNELYFSTSWNNDQLPEAMGKYLQDKGINELYVLAPNYQAGKDMVAGLKRYYKGRIVEEVYTKFQQQDYQAEISQLRSKNPKAVFAFYPGGMGIQFVKQYVQAGLRDQIPLYTVFTVDET